MDFAYGMTTILHRLRYNPPFDRARKAKETEAQKVEKAQRATQEMAERVETVTRGAPKA